MVQYIIISRGGGSGQNIYPPDPACSKQERTSLSQSEREAKERENKRQSWLQDLQTLVCPQDCIVGNALALHSVIMQQMKLTGMQACSHAAAMQQKCTGAHTHTHTQTHTHARSSYSTQAVRKASTRMQQQ